MLKQSDISNSFCLQWLTTSSKVASNTFPVTFTTCYNVVGILYKNSSANIAACDIIIEFTSSGVTRITTGGEYTVNILAIGKKT